MKKRYWFLIVALVAGGVIFQSTRKTVKATEVTLDKAERGDITSVVTATGKVFPEVEVKISSEVAGEIVELPVSDGQRVAKGAILVRVNPDTLDAQVKQKEAALRANEANALEAKARMLQAELELARTKDLFAKGFATEDKVDLGLTQLEIAKASYSATLSRIEQQSMSLKESSDELSKATTYSPIDGTITQLDAELGDRVVGTGQFEGTEIMRVADLSRMEIRVEVSEADIVSVKIGDKAKVEIEALPKQEFFGSVSEIANSASKNVRNTQDQLTSFQVKVRLIDPSDAIRPGMTATADIETKTVTGVVKVPLQAVTVRQRDDVEKQLKPKGEESKKPEAREPNDAEKDKKETLRRVVFIFSDGIAKLTPVETGLSDNRFIEITSGVAEGDEIVTGSYRILTRELKHDAKIQKAKGDSKEKKAK